MIKSPPLEGLFHISGRLSRRSEGLLWRMDLSKGGFFILSNLETLDYDKVPSWEGIKGWVFNVFVIYSL